MLALVIRAKVGWRLLSISKSHTARGLSAVFCRIYLRIEPDWDELCKALTQMYLHTQTSFLLSSIAPSNTQIHINCGEK